MIVIVALPELNQPEVQLFALLDASTAGKLPHNQAETSARYWRLST